MAFPLAPTNGQTAVLNGVTYSYSTSTSAWTRVGLGFTGTVYTLNISNNTAASSTITGALVVKGGAGIGGALYAGNIYSNGVLVNAAGTQGTTGAGTQGTTGGTGNQGTTGGTGNQGTTGTGNQGTTGTGNQGTTGAGTQGTTGAQGTVGTATQGTTGAGTQGNTGAQGVTGTGNQGTTGAGTQGTTGGTGNQGVTGTATQGTTGVQGATGTAPSGTLTEVATWTSGYLGDGLLSHTTGGGPIVTGSAGAGGPLGAWQCVIYYEFDLSYLGGYNAADIAYVHIDYAYPVFWNGYEGGSIFSIAKTHSIVRRNSSTNGPYLSVPVTIACNQSRNSGADYWPYSITLHFYAKQ
jgi:hypothetical protein